MFHFVTYLLRSIGEIGLVLGCQTSQTVRCVERCYERRRGIAVVGVVEQDLRDIGGSEKREGKVKPRHKVVLSTDILRRERCSLVGWIELVMLDGQKLFISYRCCLT